MIFHLILNLFHLRHLRSIVFSSFLCKVLINKLKALQLSKFLDRENHFPVQVCSKRSYIRINDYNERMKRYFDYWGNWEVCGREFEGRWRGGHVDINVSFTENIYVIIRNCFVVSDKIFGALQEDVG